MSAFLVTIPARSVYHTVQDAKEAAATKARLMAENVGLEVRVYKLQSIGQINSEAQKQAAADHNAMWGRKSQVRP